MTETALIDLDGFLIHLRRGGAGEPRVVLESDEANTNLSPALLDLYQTFANRPHESLQMAYVPHWPLAIGEVLVKRFGGQVIDFSRPELSAEPLPNGICF